MIEFAVTLATWPLTVPTLVHVASGAHELQDEECSRHVPTFPGMFLTKPRMCWTVCWTPAASDRVSSTPSGSVGRVVHTRSSGNRLYHHTGPAARSLTVPTRRRGLGPQADNY